MKGLLLDTHVLLWWLDDNPRLPSRFRIRITDPALPCFFSAASIWEIGIKRALGKLEAPLGLIGTLEEEGFRGLAMELVHAEAVAMLPLHHHDPFDRMLIAQARAESLAIASVDRRFSDYDVELL